ncbi:MAG TPA: DUF983 domain-containing protein [Gemmatimonadaceae bacterium]|nr:DUF983 domain-containing protein [Gemmatimonadaceae bacterium]
MRLPEELRDPDRRTGPAPRVPEHVAFGPGATTTESAMAVPSWRQLFRLMGRALRLRCPHCGIGAVLRPYATVNDHCAHCGFRFTRSSDSYYSGAMLTNLAVAEGLFAIVFGVVLVASWPDVPWDLLTWGMPLGVALAPILLLPFAKVSWLTFDVAFRPVQPEEIEPVGRA